MIRFSEQSLSLSFSYQLVVERSWNNESIYLDEESVSVYQWLQSRDVSFDYILLRGHYKVSFRLVCDTMDYDDEELGCDNSVIWSAPLSVLDFHPTDVGSSWCLMMNDDNNLVEKYVPVVQLDHINYTFAYKPCHKVLPYEQVVVSVFKSADNDSVCQNGLEILKTSVQVTAAHLLNGDEAVTAVIEYQVRQSQSKTVL